LLLASDSYDFSSDDFLDEFPTETREQAIALLEEAGKLVVGLVA
jgi:hypothetical protein